MRVGDDDASGRALSQRRASMVSIGRLAAGTPHRRALA
jgi:hypothetical protein